jgi:hypothetical protein
MCLLPSPFFFRIVCQSKPVQVRGVIIMSITVEKLLKYGKNRYRMKLLAGRKGLNNLVQWVHIVEDENVSKFLHGNELVFTAGILNNNPNWLIEFARKLHEVGASAFVINIGPYTKTVPDELIHYCNEVDMPLYTIPWETLMVEMTRDFCHKIMQNEQKEISMATTIKNIIFKMGDFDTQISYMERFGYSRDSDFCFVVMTLDSNDEEHFVSYMQEMKIYAEKAARSIHELYISFTYTDSLVLVLTDNTKYDVENFVKRFMEYTRKGKITWEAHIGISPCKTGISKQDENFEKALFAMKMARRMKEKVIYYDELGIYKILLAVKDKNILKEFYDEILGKLVTYDKEKQTELVDFLRFYLENNGSQQIMSEKQYIHRNTVTNKLRKIEKITGLNPMDLDAKTKFSMGFYIKDII